MNQLSKASIILVKVSVYFTRFISLLRFISFRYLILFHVLVNVVLQLFLFQLVAKLPKFKIFI